MLPLTILSATGLVGACTSTPIVTPDAPTVYLNNSIGLSIDQLDYNQTEFPCSVDNELVEHIALRSAYKNIRIQEVYTYMEMEKTDNILALDITELPSGSDINYVGSRTLSPKLGVSAVYINKKTGMKNEYTSQCTGTLEMGSYSRTGVGGGEKSTVIRSQTSGGGICTEMRRCARKISGEIASWLMKDNKL